tara:strand:+ start:1856 stop:2485 length:630 start_codon:yes stop_codon:yes gene_type:complete
MLKFIKPEERLNVLTHALGVLIGIGITPYFFFFQGDLTFQAKIGLAVYCFSFIFLFSASTIYHTVSGDLKIVWRKIDHIAILFLIAGTYTPVTLTVLYERTGLLMLTAVWSIAILGLIFKLFYTGRFEILSLTIYLGMGWLVVFDIETILQLFSETALFYLILGGFFYTVGVYFYCLKGLKETHAVWHVFVLVGATSHVLMIQEILLLE